MARRKIRSTAGSRAGLVWPETKFCSTDDTDDDVEDPEELNQRNKVAEDNLPEDIVEGKYK